MDANSIGAIGSATPTALATTNTKSVCINSAPTRRSMLASLAILPLAACPASAPATGPAGVSAELSALLVAAHGVMAERDRYEAEVAEPARLRANAAIERIPHYPVTIDGSDYWTTARPASVHIARSLIENDQSRTDPRSATYRSLIAADLRRDRHATRIRRDTGMQAAIDHSNGLSDRVAATEWAVANFPAATPADFHAKVAFMVERFMFDGLDHSAQMLADAARLTGKEA